MSLDPLRFRRRAASAALVALALAVALAPPATAQVFTRVHDPANPITTDPGPIGFTGASWIDVDGNGWPDLFLSNIGLYLNHGGGAFTKLTIAGNETGLGNCWADYDNDGDPDLLLAGGAGNGRRGSRLFRNDGGGVFTIVTAGATGDSLGNAGWACAWGDYDADGRVDAVIAAPYGFTGTNPNRLLHNAGDGTFTQDTSTDVTVGVAPYTVPTWCDFDLDGDLDLSIGAGPANGSRGPDYFYRNLTVEGGAPLLARITTGSLATDTRDGQIINWPDYDNDGDHDCFITNYRLSTNSLYRNDGGTFVRMTTFTAGPIAGDGFSLSSTWEDFDNDGDLDCYLVRNSGANRYYRNEGNGTFALVAMDTLTSGPSTTATAADWDRDGDVDLYVSAPAGPWGLYRNEAPAGNHWFQIHLTGSSSNRSGIGARVRLRTTIGGQVVNQLREVSAQNVFNGHSSFVQHFGLGDAAAVEWLEVAWPSGLVETFTKLPRDTMLALVEGEGFPTPTLASIVSARWTGYAVELEWYGSALEPDAAIVHRRPVDGDAWSALGEPVPAGVHLARFVDETAGPGSWAYRLGDRSSNPEWLTEATIVTVPAPGLSLRAAAPRASGGGLRLDLTLPAAGAAGVDVFDARGRRLAAHDLGVLEAGAHTIELAGRVPGPGVYWVRLVHGGVDATARVILSNPR